MSTDTVPVNRQTYLSGKVDHATYYLALVDVIGRAPIEGLVKGVIRQSTGKAVWMDVLKRSYNADEHLNNIPLHLWDARHEHLLELIRFSGHAKDIMAITYPHMPYDGKFSWSLSDSVCVLKAAAKRMALEAK